MPHTINNEKGVIDKQIYQRSSTTKLALETFILTKKNGKTVNIILRRFKQIFPCKSTTLLSS